MTAAAKSGQFTAGEVGKAQFIGGNRRNLAKEKIMRDFVSRSLVVSLGKALNRMSLPLSS